MKKNILFLLFQILYCSISISQVSTFNYYVDTLCSEYFKGRGYVDEGHVKAANFIANEFKSIGLKNDFAENYFQDFPIDVNTFPEKVELSIQNRNLRTGYDFIIDPYSGSLKGRFFLRKTTLNNWMDLFKNEELKNQTMVLIDVSELTNKDSLASYNELKLKLVKEFPVLWVTSGKLTWSVSSYVFDNPVVTLKSDALKKTDQFIDINLKHQFQKGLIAKNIIGNINGRRNKSIIISAHYDHLGMMGDVIYPGANDNASGVSLILNLAKYLKSKRNKYNIIFICFGAEEVGLKGSYYFNEHPLVDLEKVKLVLNFDIVGTGDEGIALVNALGQKKYVKKIGKINKRSNAFNRIKIRGQAPNSDHYWFSKNDVPALFLYTLGGIDAYHDPLDKSETLPLTKIDALFSLVLGFLKEI